MKEINQATTIYRAFKESWLGKIPKNERDYPEWYKYRLDACKTCKFNTKNIPLKLLPVQLWVTAKMGKARCACCTCFIKEKAWMKSEECGLAEIGGAPDFLPKSYLDSTEGDNVTPRWKRLQVVTVNSDEFNVETTDTSLYDVFIDQQGEFFVLDFPNLKQGDHLSFSFIIHSKSRLKGVGFKSGCGCTSPMMRDVGSGDFLATVEVNTEKWGPGNFRKDIWFNFAENYDEKDESKQKVCPVRLMMHIVEPEKPKEDAGTSEQQDTEGIQGGQA